MDDLVFLGPILAPKSLSAVEIVLTLQDTEEAVRHLAQQNIAVLGWEMWYQYPDGRRGHGGHRSDYQRRQHNEGWAEFIHRTANACLVTAHQAHDEVAGQSDHPRVQVYFCLSIATEDELD